jgi:hypothetical protein
MMARYKFPAYAGMTTERTYPRGSLLTMVSLGLDVKGWEV